MFIDFFSVLQVIYREIFLCRFVDNGIVSGIKIGEGLNAHPLLIMHKDWQVC